MSYHQGLVRQRGFGDYHRGLLRQKGFGLVGSLLKIGGPLVTGALGPVIGEVLGGLVRKKQTGKGIVGDVLRGGYEVTKNAIIDRFKNKVPFMEGLRTRTKNRLKRFAIPLVDRQLMRNVPGIRAPFVGDLLRKKVLPLVKNKVANLIDANVDKFLGGQTGKGRRRKRRKQRGRGVVTDLLKGGIKGSKAVKDLIKGGMRGGIKQLPQLLKRGTKGLIRSGVKEGVKKGAQDLVKEGTRQAIHSAAQAGLDALEGKKSLKEAVLNRGLEGLQKTGQTMETKLLSSSILAKGGPHKRKRRKVKIGTGKKARLVDIFD